MARQSLNPQDYGIALSRAQFFDWLATDFLSQYHGGMTIDELVVNPREALHFCDQIRKNHGWYELPDNVILRSLMNMRKASPRRFKPQPRLRRPTTDGAEPGLFDEPEGE